MIKKIGQSFRRSKLEKTRFLVYSFQFPETDDNVVLILQQYLCILESQTEINIYMRARL